MKTYSVKDIKRLARIYEFRPSRRSGQNFLVDGPTLQRIVQAAQLSPSDRVLEVGAGFGSLTVQLAQKAHKVWAVELDKRLIGALHKLLAFYPQVELVEGDILRLNIAHIVGKEPYKVVANIPYNITSLFLRNVLTLANPPQTTVLLLQREVAERIVAEPGQMSLLSLSIQIFTEPEIVSPVPSRAFWPQPEVDSAIVRLHRRSPQDIAAVWGTEETLQQGFRLMRMGFAAKRKILKNNLRSGLRCAPELLEQAFTQLQLSPTVRAQELTLETWLDLTHQLSGVWKTIDVK